MDKQKILEQLRKLNDEYEEFKYRYEFLRSKLVQYINDN